MKDRGVGQINLHDGTDPVVATRARVDIAVLQLVRVTTVSLVGAGSSLSRVLVPGRVNCCCVVTAVSIEVKVRLELQFELGSALSERREDITLLGLGSRRGGHDGHGAQERGGAVDETRHRRDII